MPQTDDVGWGRLAEPCPNPEGKPQPRRSYDGPYFDMDD